MVTLCPSTACLLTVVELATSWTQWQKNQLEHMCAPSHLRFSESVFIDHKACLSL